MGMGLQNLEAFVKFCEKVTAQGYPTKRFVSASMELRYGEGDKSPADEIAAQHEKMLAESEELENKIQTLTSEINGLASEKERAEASPEADSLDSFSGLRYLSRTQFYGVSTLQNLPMSLLVYTLKWFLKKEGVLSDSIECIDLPSTPIHPLM